MGTSVDSLRRAGLSRQKIGYIHDLCRRILEGSLRLDALDRMEDAAVIEALTEVKGIGRWTAEMFLIFKLHRPDVLPVDDLGIVKAIQRAYRPAQAAAAGSDPPDRRSVAAVPIDCVVVSVGVAGHEQGTGRGLVLGNWYLVLGLVRGGWWLVVGDSRFVGERAMFLAGEFRRMPRRGRPQVGHVGLQGGRRGCLSKAGNMARLPGAG